MLEGKRVAMINLGCKANKYEADSMTDKLRSAGASICDNGDIADIYIVNTCSVTNVAEKKSRQMLRRAKKKNKDAIVVAAGCYVNASHEELEAMDDIDLIIGNNCKKDIVEVLEQYFTNRDNPNHYIDINCTNEYEEMGSLQISSLDHRRAYIKIQDGCNQFCSYCLIPYTRGRVRSRQPEKILSEILSLAKEGIKEFVLTGIHISSYGMDFSKKDMEYDDIVKGQGEFVEDERIDDLGSLVHAIEKIPEVKRIRLGSLEPRIITPRFLDLVGKSDKLCPHFHLSLQSACNATLKRMNRKYTLEEFEQKCILLRTYFDNPAITTDVIVGFPGETGAEFDETIENLKRLNLYEIHVFKYSVRTGTLAEKMPNQVDEQTKNIRSDVLLALTKQQKEDYEKQCEGMVEQVLIEEKISKETADSLKKAFMLTEENSDGGCYYTGHTGNYIKVSVFSREDIVNQIVDVTIG